ncbi:signal transduction histidine kinase [Cylindrospermum stagnale PCC 7417]|uniref:histidine kinase n=1 Tax=Cylindrospermum stagnale PCC 7417 TaxID=56107 RepID=K9WYQ8_9NOST|nr:PAS domain S-box protein [Cylindrospermum stagnale]AFZ24936.1 signal transduction histidine kinase [Cylindrospermum stagnale PCC 7417]
MTLFNYSTEELWKENQVLRERLVIAEDTLQAIHQGTVDAFVISTPEGEKIFTLQSADYTYRLLVEQMCEGAVIITSDGWILYANQAFANLLKHPLEKIISSRFQEFILERDINIFQSLRKKQEQELTAIGELSLVNINEQEIPVYLAANKFNVDNHYINCIIITDLTENRQNQEIIASEKFARSILEQVGESVVVCNQKGIIIRASQVFKTLCCENYLFQDFDQILSLYYSKLDIHIKPQETQSDQNIVTENFLIENCFSISRVLQGQHYKGVEVYFQRSNGERVDLLLNACPLLNSMGEIIGAIINLTDITERKRQEAELHLAKVELEMRVAERTAELSELNKQLRLTLDDVKQKKQILLEQSKLLDLAHDTILTLDLNMVITFWNKGGEQMYGWKKSEAVGQVSHILLQTQFPQPFAEIQAQLLNLGYWEGELIHTDKNGISITVFSRWVLQKDDLGRPIKILEINNDITSRKQKEAALQASETKFRSLSECLPIGLFVIDQQGICTYANPCFLQIFGLTMAEVMGQSWLALINADNKEKLLNQWLRVFKDIPETFDHEIRYLHKDGKTRYARIILAPMLMEKTNLSGYIGTVEDVTKIRAVEQVKRDFISIVSHELRTPLTAIHGSLGLLAGKVYDKKPDKRSQMLNIAASQTERLVRLVNDILCLEKLESGEMKLVKQRCDAAKLIIDSADTMQAIAQKQHINLNVKPLSVEVWANSDAIIQTLTNLLSNAIKFSEPHTTISVSNKLIETKETQAQIFSHLANRSIFNFLTPPYILFQVQDEGQGIPADKLESIFGWFQQVDASNAREKSGTGLGLAICQKIIRQHGGYIWAESRLGQGSTFFFTLPLALNT